MPPFESSSPVIIIPAKTATAFEIVGFGVNPTAGILDLMYATGDMVDGKFVPDQNGAHPIHIEGDEFSALMTAYPALTPLFKQALYGLIEAKYAASGAIV